jgi:hypothetical protein
VTTPQPGDTYSPRTVRVALALITLGLAATAVFLVDGWLVFLFGALAVLSGCATITPPFRRPN